MSSKPIISFRVENERQDRISAVDVIASGFLLVVAYVVIACVLSFVLKIGCVFIGVEFTWVLPLILALVIEIVLCTI
jgi:hypothetical protein